MLLIIDTKYITCVVEVADNSYDSVCKAFCNMGHPEYNLRLKENESLNPGTKYDIFDWDDIADVMVKNNKPSIFEVEDDNIESIGTAYIAEDKFVFITGEIAE